MEGRHESASEGAGVVVVGGGIVGLTAAFYLARQGNRVTLVEKCAIACHSSGKGGGFLTDGDSGWHQWPISSLAKHSFSLHEELADHFGAERIGFRKVRCIGAGAPREGEPVPEWLDQESYGQDMAGRDGMAQITPYMLMAALEEDAVSNGCEVRIGKVVGVERDGDTVRSVMLEKKGCAAEPLHCSSVILAMGPWADEAASWFPDCPMPTRTVSNRYTSVIWDDVTVGKDATMVFTSGQHQTEIYPRSNECYANGCPSVRELPDDPLEITPPRDEIEKVIQEARAAVQRLRSAKVLRTTACFLAGSDDNLPVIGLVPGVGNAVVACGGGCWGLLNGPAMGQAAAALALGREPEVDVAPFDPKRFGQLLEGIGEDEITPMVRQVLEANPDLLNFLRQVPPEAARVTLAEMREKLGE